MKHIIMSLCGLFISTQLFSQNSSLKGRVLDPENGRPLAGASVQLKNNTVITDEAGNFSIPCSDSSEIVISYVNYQPYVIKHVACGSEITVNMQQASQALNEVEITATSNSNKALLYQPQSIVKLSETELKRGNGLFLDDAINTNIPGVYMERRTSSAGQQFNIRGYGNGARGTNGVNSNFDTQGSKVYLNGIPVTDAEGITLMDDIDFGSVSNVEVLKGPSGHLYGLAIAGVVNLKTRQAEKGKVSVGQDALFGSYGLKRLTTHVELGGERSSVLINYGKQTFDGFMPHTAAHKDFVNVVGQFKPNEKQTIGTYVGFSNSYDERNGELTIGQYDTLNYSGNPSYIKNNAHSKIISFRAGVSHTYLFNKHFSNTTTVFGSGVNNNATSAGGYTDKLPVNYGFRTTLDLHYDLGTRFNISGITGMEAQEQDASTIGANMVADSSNLAGYNIVGSMRSNQATVSRTSTLFTDWTLNMPYAISLTAGVGLSNMYIELNDRFYVAANNKPVTRIPTRYKTSYNNMAAPHFALNKVISKQLSVYASYSMGYKAPVSSYFYIPTTGELNTALKPEVAQQYEAGVKGSLLKDKLQFQVAVFNAVFSNKMTAVAVPLNSVTTAYSYMVNGGAQNNKGLEVLVKYTAYQSETGIIKALKPFANFCYSDFKYENFKFQTLNAARTQVIETDYSGKTVAGVPPITANAGLDLLFKYGFYANVNYSYRDAMYFTSDNLNKTKAFGLLNAKAGFHYLFFKHLDAELHFGANNIAGTQYYYMVFLNQLPDAYLPAPNEINYFGGINLKYTF
jgi:iron complex outermembrane receptor protein